MLGLAASMVYLPVCLVSLLLVWRAQDGDFLVVVFYLMVVTNDAFAQLTGELAGSRRLAAQISPGKTVEGAAGGIVAAALLGAVLSGVAGWSPGLGSLVGAVVAAAAQTGDLVESSWKRALGLKDFSTLLGAQGGVLDRFDGLLFAAPIFYVIVTG
jgi:phosphatidate cytidylyltransferase